MAKTILMAGNANGGSTTTANTDGFWNLSGLVGIDNTTEANKEIKIQQAGTISNLYAVVATNSIASANTTIITRKNAGNGGQTLTIGSSATGEFEDTTNTDSISAADRICAKFHPGAASGTLNIRQISVLFNATTDTVSVLSCDGPVSFTTASTTWFTVIEGYIANPPPTTETFAKCRIRKTFTAKKLGAYVSSNRATNTTIRTRKNGANGGQTITVTGGGASGWYEDTSGTDSLAAGDDFNYSIVTGTGADTLTIQRIKCEYNSTGGDGLSTGGRSTGTAINDNTTGFSPLGGIVDFSNTSESVSQGKARVAFTYSNLEVMVSQNDVTSASTLDLRKGAASQAVTVSITGSGTGLFEDTTHSYAGATGDEMNFRLVVPSVSGTHTVTVTSATIHTAAANDYTVALSTETVSISDSISRLLAATRVNTETTNSTESLARMIAANRALSTETTTISESLARSKGQTRTMGTETVSSSESLNRMTAATRALPETTSISETLARMLAANRALGTESTTVSDSIARVKGVIRALATETVTIAEDLQRMLAANRALSTETTTISDSIARLLAATRTLSDTTAISDSLNRLVGFVRTLSDTTAISDSIIRMLAATRTLSDTTVISDSLARMKAATRTLVENVSIGETLARMLAAIRTLSDTTTISDVLDYVKSGGGTFVRTLTETVNISDSITRMFTGSRTLNENVTVSDSLARMLGLTRLLSDSTTISDSINRVYGAVRTLTDNTVISDSLVKVKAVFKTLTENVSISDSVQRLFNGTRQLVDTTTITDSLAKLLTRLSPPTQLKKLKDFIIAKYTLSGVDPSL